MKATTDEIRSYSFCPKFWEQKGSFSKWDESQELFGRLVTYCFRRDLELEAKLPRKAILARWNKIAGIDYPRQNAGNLSEVQIKKLNRRFNRSVIAVTRFYKWYEQLPATVLGVNHELSISVYGHELVAQIPVLLHDTNGGITIIITESLEDLSTVKFDPAIRYASMALAEEFTVNRICNISLEDFQVFHVEEFEPTNRYWESALIDFTGVMQSMQNSITYPNTAGCATCPIVETCDVLKGNA